MPQYKTVIDDEDDEMLEEYDFSNGIRGLHYLGKNVKIRVPIYLAPDVFEHYSRLAHARNLPTGDYLSEILRPQIVRECTAE